MKVRRMCDLLTTIVIAGALYSGCLSPAEAQNTTCSDRPASDSSNACANTRFVHSATANVPLVPIENFAGSCTSTDNTTALINAAASVAGPVRILFSSSCTYNFTQANAINFTKPVMLIGTGPSATILAYNPTIDGTFLNWSNGLNVLYAAGGAGYEGITITSSDTTHIKTLTTFTDVSGFRAVNSSIGWPYGQITNGTCLYPKGRETGYFQGLTLSCDTNLRIGMNPHAYLTQDHFHYTDLYLVGTGAPIVVDPGVVFTDTTFDGYQAWVSQAATNSFDYNDTGARNLVSSIGSAGTGYVAGTPITLTGGTCSTPIQILPLTVSAPGGVLTAAVSNPGVCTVIPSNPVSAASGGATFNLTIAAGFRLSFSNPRSEGSTDITKYTFNIQPAGALQGLTIVNAALDTNRCGVFLKNVLFADIKDSNYPNNTGCGKVVDATSANSNDMLTYSGGNFWGTGVTQNVTGLTRIDSIDGPATTSATVPTKGTYSATTTLHARYNWVDVTNNITATTFNNVGITPPASTAALNLGSGITASLPVTGTYTTRDSVDTLTNKSISGSTNTLTNIGNISLTNPATTVNGQTCTLGSTCTVSASATSVTVGSTTVVSGTTLRVLYDNAGVLGEYTNTQLTALINPATTTLSGALPAWPNNTTTFFRGDGTYNAVAVSSLGGLGTGVAGALAVNVGSAGAFVTFNGALGTPSSGTVTNLTGTASININGTVGATTPTTGAFTTVTASTSISSPIHTASGVLTFQSNGSTAAGVIDAAQQWVIGSATSTLTGTRLLVTNNSSAAPNPGFASTQQIVGADASSGTLGLFTFQTGATQPGISYLKARGTSASPTAVSSSDRLGSNFAFGYATSGGAGYVTNAGAGFIMVATENYTSTVAGARLDLIATPGGTATSATVASAQTGFWVGNTTDPGAGKVSALNGYVANGLSGISTVCTIAVGNALTFTLGILTAKGGTAGCT